LPADFHFFATLTFGLIYFLNFAEIFKKWEAKNKLKENETFVNVFQPTREEGSSDLFPLKASGIQNSSKMTIH
jgi:hypothetical protein